MNRDDPAALTEAQIAYLAVQPLGRLATNGPEGGPQNKPVTCYYNPTTQTIDIGGRNMATSRKYRNVQANPKIALVVDDMPNRDPSNIRCLEIRGNAQAIADPTDSSARVPGAIIRIKPRRIVSWGVDLHRW